MKGSDINPLALFAEGNPQVSTKRRIVFLDPKGRKDYASLPLMVIRKDGPLIFVFFNAWA